MTARSSVLIIKEFDDHLVVRRLFSLEVDTRLEAFFKLANPSDSQIAVHLAELGGALARVLKQCTKMHRLGSDLLVDLSHFHAYLL